MTTVAEEEPKKKRGGHKKAKPSIPSIQGTLKVQVIKPIGESWDVVGERLRTLRRVIGPALNQTMRLLYPRALQHIHGEEAEQSLETAVYGAAVKDGRCLAIGIERDEMIQKKLNENTENAMKARAVKELGRPDVRKLSLPALLELARPNHAKLADDIQKTIERVDTTRSHAPILASVADATAKGIVARFRGEHLKDLQQGRASLPSWKVGAPLVARAHDCAVAGSANEANLSFPLWKSGAGATVLRVAPNGASGRATWSRLVRGEYKLGTVSLKYDERRRKWYALITWTGEGALRPSAGQAASLNFGVNVFLTAVAEDGTIHRVDGGDILHMRRKAWHRRSDIQRSLDSRGDGGRGHGKTRALQSITQIEDADSRFSATKNRQVAAGLLTWCQRHGVGLLYVEDLKDLRDSVGADEHSEVKRLIHTWPFFQLRKDIERAAEKAGTVRIQVSSPSHVSQTCPWCDHVSADNVKTKPGRKEFLSYHGREWSRADKTTVFTCVNEKCLAYMDGDAVACVNHLKKQGHSIPPKIVKENAHKELDKKTSTVFANATIETDVEAAEE